MVIAGFYRGYQIQLLDRAFEYRITKGDRCMGYARSIKMAHILIDEMENPE